MANKHPVGCVNGRRDVYEKAGCCVGTCVGGHGGTEVIGRLEQGGHSHGLALQGRVCWGQLRAGVALRGDEEFGQRRG